MKKLETAKTGYLPSSEGARVDRWVESFFERAKKGEVFTIDEVVAELEDATDEEKAEVFDALDKKGLLKKDTEPIELPDDEDEDSEEAEEDSETSLGENPALAATVSGNSLPSTVDPYWAFLQKAGSYPLLSKEETLALFKRLEAGDKSAKEEIANHNLRLVISIAKQYARGRREDLMDCISTGNVGLMKAIDHYDYRRGAAFSTCASFWIRDAIRESFSKNYFPVEISPDMMRRVSVVDNFMKTEQAENGGIVPNNQQIADGTGYSLRQVQDALDFLNRYGNPLPLDQDIKGKDGDSSGTIGDTISSSMADETADLDRSDTRRLIEAAKEALTPQEWDIVRLNTGYDCDEMTLKEIGKKYGISAQRVQQIKEAALLKMKKAMEKGSAGEKSEK
jgi:RNA polymerase primary sigma factor